MKAKSFSTLNLTSLSFCLVVLLHHVAQAQYTDSTSHYIYYNSTGAFTKTNELKQFVLTNLVKFGISKKKFSFQTNNGWVYGKQSDKLINNDFSSSAEFDVLKKERTIYYWGLGTFDKSYSLNVDYRFQGGLGLGYTFANNDKLVVVISDGILFERGNLLDKDLGQRDYNVWRNSLRVKYRWVYKNYLILDGSGYIQPSLSSWEDNVMRSTTTLSIKLKRWLGLSATLAYNKVTLTGKENFLATYGILMERFF